MHSQVADPLLTLSNGVLCVLPPYAVTPQLLLLLVASNMHPFKHSSCLHSCRFLSIADVANSDYL